MSGDRPDFSIGVLISARKNSKYLAKFLFGLVVNTNNWHPNSIDVRVMLNEHDTWNDELGAFWSDHYPIKFYRENHRLGRAGLHQYFNELIPPLPAAWTVYFCEDHFITQDGWDDLLLDYVLGMKKSGDSDGKHFPLDPDEVWVIVPKFDNCGAMNHVVSRGFIKALGGKIGNHGWIDSYINDLMKDMPDRVIRVDEEWFHDFTHDKPSPMSDAHLQTVISKKGQAMPKYDSQTTRHRLELDREKLKRAIEKEAR